MNDDFLYRLRTEPPPPFAEALKERLDRRSKRTLRAWHFGLAVLLFGTAFAMVSPTVRLSVAEVIDWIRGVPVQTVEVPMDVNQGIARAFGERKVPAANAADKNAAPSDPASDSVKEAAAALLEEARARRRLPVTLPPLHSSSESADDADAAGADNDAPLGSLLAAQEPQSEFIVTGPLLGEFGTPAYIFEARRAYFTVTAWTMKPLEDMALRRSPIDLKTARTATYRLVNLTVMMPDMFAKDERGSNVPTRSRPEVWGQKREFLLRSYEFAQAVKGLLSAVKYDDELQLRQAIARVELACSSCHEQFRVGGNKDVGAVTP